MKKIKILIALGCFSIANIGVAQNEVIDNRERVTFGLKAGVNFSNIYNSQTEDFRADGKFGLAGGVALAIPIGQFLGIQPEVLFSQKGFKGDGTFLGSDYSFKRTTNFIDIPLLIAFKPSATITILAGPQYSYLLRQRDDFNSSWIDASHEEEFENENIRNNIFGFVAGVDVNINHFVFGSRVGWDITDNHGDGSSSTPQYKNVMLQATVGYTLFNSK